MNVIHENPESDVGSKHSLRPTHFYCHAPAALAVQLAGDFSRWNPLPMQQRDGGWWYIQLMLLHGHHEYHFLVDGKAVLDPHAMGRTRNALNEEVSVIAVG